MSEPGFIKGPILVTAAVIENSSGELLLAKRPAHHKIAGGQWEFPGGKVEPGEDPRACLIREIKEEIGITVVLGGLVGVYSHLYQTATDGSALPVPLHVVLITYRATVSEPFTIQLHDVAEVKWVSPTSKPGEIFAPADIAIVDAIWGETLR